jgi:putative redox protein
MPSQDAMPNITVQLTQVGPTSSESTIREHRIIVDRPESKGGSNLGPMGGELFLSSIGGCFLSNMYAAIRAREAAVSNVQAEIVGRLEGDPPRYEEITITASGDYDDPDLFQKLVTISERGCIMVNTLRPILKLNVVIAQPH